MARHHHIVLQPSSIDNSVKHGPNTPSRFGNFWGVQHAVDSALPNRVNTAGWHPSEGLTRPGTSGFSRRTGHLLPDRRGAPHLDGPNPLITASRRSDTTAGSGIAGGRSRRPPDPRTDRRRQQATAPTPDTGQTRTTTASSGGPTAETTAGPAPTGGGWPPEAPAAAFFWHHRALIEKRRPRCRNDGWFRCCA